MLSDDIELSPTEMSRRKRDMSHWVKTADNLYKCHDELEYVMPVPLCMFQHEKYG